MSNPVVVYCMEYNQKTDVLRRSRREQEQMEHACGRMLLRRALRSEYQIDFTEDMIERTGNEKPVLRELPVFFNISHCSSMVVCAVSDCPVGVDVEAERRVADSLIRKALSPWEREYVQKQDKIWRFLELWTLKESYSKMTGEGMRIPFASVQFQFDEQIFSEDRWREPEQLQCNKEGYFWQRKIRNCMCSVCTKEMREEPVIKVV